MENYSAEVDEEDTGKFNFSMFCQVFLNIWWHRSEGKKTTENNTNQIHPPSPVQVAAKFLIEDDEEQMKEELKEAFRIYDKEGQGFITTDVLKVELPSRAGNKPSRSFVASCISDAQIIGQY